jgi:hypothetical protein
MLSMHPLSGPADGGPVIKSRGINQMATSWGHHPFQEAMMSGAISALGGGGAWSLGAVSDRVTLPTSPALQAQVTAAEAVVNAISMATVPLDIASFGAILGSVQGTAASAGPGGGEAATVQSVMAMIGKTLSQGQGGYYIAINAPGASVMTAMTPGQLRLYMQNGGTLDQDNVVSSDGHTYSMYGLLQQAFAANTQTEQMQAADPALADPKLTVAEALLDQMRADSAPASSARSVLFGSSSHGPDTSRAIRTIVLQMSGTTRANGVVLTVVYFPPNAGAPAAAGSSTQADTPSSLHLSA